MKQFCLVYVVYIYMFLYSLYSFCLVFFSYYYVCYKFQYCEILIAVYILHVSWMLAICSKQVQEIMLS